jgi:hypothetical protein
MPGSDSKSFSGNGHGPSIPAMSIDPNMPAIAPGMPQGAVVRRDFVLSGRSASRSCSATNVLAMRRCTRQVDLDDPYAPGAAAGLQGLPPTGGTFVQQTAVPQQQQQQQIPQQQQQRTPFPQRQECAL